MLEYIGWEDTPSPSQDLSRQKRGGACVDNFLAGVVLCSETTRSYLINYARTLIYTTSAPFTSLVSIDVVYDYIQSGKADAHRKHLQGLIQYTHQCLLELCARQMLPSPKRLITVRNDPPKSPIIPVLTGYPRSLAAYCQENGFMVRPIVPPTVPLGGERVRICLHAGNTIPQVDKLCRVIGLWIHHQQEVSGKDQRTLREHRRDQTPQMTIEKAKI